MALASFAAGLALAWHHPVWPVAALVFFYFACIATAWWPGSWLLVVPAALPWLNFSPWTGWLVFEEFDLLLLGIFAGAYARLAWSCGNGIAGCGFNRNRRESRPSDIVLPVLVTTLGVLGVVSLLRGLDDAGGLTFSWFQGYTDALNSLRVFKSLLFGILTIPLLRGEMRVSGTRAGNRLALGMVLGLASVSLAALWERAAYPGLFDFSTVYRVTGLFWEMHIGGGAIDAYLAMAMPFVVWALWAARGPLSWVLSAALALLAAYACLTTFSRGVYVAVVLPLIPMALTWRARSLGFDGSPSLHPLRPSGRSFGRRAKAGWSLGLVIGLLIGAVLIGGTLGMGRFNKTDRDFAGRLAHWQRGIGLLHSSADWWLGMGLGRLPANYARRAPNADGELPGRVQLHERGSGTPGHPYVTIFGPATRPDLEGLFALTQRVGIEAASKYRVSMEIRAPVATSVAVQLCERHLLYDWYCQDALIRVRGLPGQWQRFAVQLSGDELGRWPWYAPRLGMLGISVLDPGAGADFYNISLVAGDRKELLANGDFSRSLAQWFPTSQYYFLPWHIDSLYLEVLIERGIAGLSVFAALVLWALMRLLSGPGKELNLSPYLAASLVGAASIGAVSSMMDVSRVAFLLFLLVFFALQWTDQGAPS